jgi:hypothetical protein
MKSLAVSWIPTPVDCFYVGYSHIHMVFCIFFAMLITDILFIVDIFCVVGTAQFTAQYLVICCGHYSRPLAIPTGPREHGRDEGCD